MKTTIPVHFALVPRVELTGAEKNEMFQLLDQHFGH